MNSYAPLLPYTIAFWLGLPVGLDFIEFSSACFFLWIGLGSWIGFNWKYLFSTTRALLVFVCFCVGIYRGHGQLKSTIKIPDDQLICFTLKASKPEPILQREYIYTHAETRKYGAVSIKWPSSLPYPSTWVKVVGRWYDDETNIYYRSLGCRGLFRPIAVVEFPQNNLPSRYRQRMDSILVNSSVSLIARGFLLGLSTGDKSLINKEIRTLFSESGIAHILAVSGYHVGLVGFIPLLMLRSIRREIRWLAIGGLVFIWLFIIACGSPWSAVRSGLMVTVMCMSVWSGKRLLPFQALTLSAWIIGWIDPYAPIQLGTQLSFAATASILSIVHNPKLLLIRIPIAAQTATFSWIASTFKSLPIWFLPINIIASPLVAVIGVLLGVGFVTSDIIPNLSVLLVKLAANVSDIGIKGLLWFKSVSVISFTVENHWRFICAGFVGWGWLLRNLIPSLLSRFVAIVGIGGIVIELVRIIFTWL